LKYSRGLFGDNRPILLNSLTDYWANRDSWRNNNIYKTNNLFPGVGFAFIFTSLYIIHDQYNTN
jgi:hypothetical protein